MIQASHNTMTYLIPKYWIFRPFRFMAKCQEKTLEEQYKCGVRYFDFRIVFIDTIPHFAHGLITFKGDVYKYLDFLNSCEDKIYVRILNERNKNFNLFIDFCKEIQSKYSNIIFLEGVNKKDWRCVYNFETTCDKKTIDKYSSWNYDTSIGTGWYLDDLYPRIYAFCFNCHWREKYKNEDVYLLQDFVGVY